MTLTYGSLFSGIGGLDRAVEQVTGASCAWQSEIEPGPVKVLEQHFPGVPNLGDITAIDWETVEPVDIICGGFPCQDISSAGRGAGIKEGTRSGLWYRYADAVRVLRPRYVLVENVGALVVRGLGIVVGDLAALGYRVEWGCLAASAVGAPHRRERIFLLAADTDRRRQSREPQLHGATVEDPAIGPALGGHALGRGLEGVWETSSYAAAIGRWERIIGRPAPDPTDERGRLNPPLPEWMMGLPEGWVTDHLERSPALKAIGNAVCPQQAVAAYTALFDRLAAVS